MTSENIRMSYYVEYFGERLFKKFELIGETENIEKLDNERKFDLLNENRNDFLICIFPSAFYFKHVNNNG